MRLTVLKIKHAKPAEKAYTLSDGNGLQLEITPEGKKHWRYRYQLNGHRNRMSFGSYPDVGLKEARTKRNEAEELISKKIDPVELKQKNTSEESQLPSEISVKAYKPMVYRGLPVIPTQLLAELYGNTTKHIQQNFKRNEHRFVEGKHYFKLEGEELQIVKNLPSQRGQVKIPAQTPVLMLWTERGAARHAKMLETDAAWDVFEKLEDAYFTRGVPKTVEKASEGKKYLHRFVDMDVITSLTIAEELQLDHSHVVATVFTLEQSSEVFELNFPIGEEVVQGRERVSVVAMTLAGFNLLMENYAGEDVDCFKLRVAEEFALCRPVESLSQALETVPSRFIKPRVNAQKMLALKGALRIYAAIENRAYEEVVMELCSYFKLLRLEDLGVESYEIALDYVWAVIERPFVLESETEVLCSEGNASLIRGALDLWTYHADERTYEEVMEEFEATTGLATPGEVPEKDVFKVLLFIWGKLSAALALKEAA